VRGAQRLMLPRAPCAGAASHHWMDLSPPPPPRIHSTDQTHSTNSHQTVTPTVSHRTVTRMRLTDEKRRRYANFASRVASMTTCSLDDFQSLLGRLTFASQTHPPAVPPPPPLSRHRAGHTSRPPAAYRRASVYTCQRLRRSTAARRAAAVLSTRRGSRWAAARRADFACPTLPPRRCAQGTACSREGHSHLCSCSCKCRMQCGTHTPSYLQSLCDIAQASKWDSGFLARSARYRVSRSEG
jgi:hypothetical protein